MEWPGVFLIHRSLTIDWWFLDARRQEQAEHFLSKKVRKQKRFVL
jgi:hypothetical protein